MALFSRPGRPTFGTLGPSHAAACAELHTGSFAHGWSEMEFERLLAATTVYADAAFDRRAVSGFIVSRAAADEAEVLTIIVAPRKRGRGLARDLLTRHLDRLIMARVRTLFLEVNVDNAPARALYARAGFAEVGLRKGYYAAPVGGPRADALVLRRSIG